MPGQPGQGVRAVRVCIKSTHALYICAANQRTCCTCMCLCLCLQIVKCITDAQHNAHRVRARSGGMCCTFVHQINVHTERACACACSASLAHSFKCITGAHRETARPGGQLGYIFIDYAKHVIRDRYVFLFGLQKNIREVK